MESRKLGYIPTMFVPSFVNFLQDKYVLKKILNIFIIYSFESKKNCLMHKSFLFLSFNVSDDYRHNGYVLDLDSVPRKMSLVIYILMQKQEILMVLFHALGIFGELN
jgi:hypothetical protein